MRSARRVGLFAALAASTGCVGSDPLRGYVFLDQWMGDTTEQGATVCGVAHGRAKVLALPHGSGLTCRAEEYGGSTTILVASTSAAPSMLAPVSSGIPAEPLPAPVSRVRAFGDWSVGLAPVFGLVVDHIASDGLERAFEVRVVNGAPLLDLEVQGAWAYVADGASDLVLVALDRLPDPSAVVRVPMGGVPRDAYVDGDRAAVLVDNDLVMVDLSDRAAPTVRGRLAFADVAAQGVGLRGDHAYVAAGGSLYTVDVSDLDAPVLLDDTGERSAFGGITLLHGDYLFQAPGFDQQLVVTDLRDPANPDPFWTFIGGNGVFDVAAAGEVLYLATGSGGVQVWGPDREASE